MGLKWRHHSRFYILAWDNGPYQVMERHWWKDKKIAQLDKSLQLAIWYVQDLDPNSTVSITYVPREQFAIHPRPTATPADASNAAVYRGVGAPTVAVVPEQSVPRTPKPPIPVGFQPFGPVQPGEKLIRLAKSKPSKYIFS